MGGWAGERDGTASRNSDSCANRSGLSQFAQPSNGYQKIKGFGEAAITSKRGMFSWALYDWANSPFTTVIITFVFSTYFLKGIAVDEVQGQSMWNFANSISAGIIAILAPVLGAIADAGGPRKPWIAVFTAMCVVGSFLLWFAEPDNAFLIWAMVWVIIATVGFEFGIVFNNAMLPDLVAEDRLGRWSGWAWGLGYFGGLCALILGLYGFVQAESPPFGITKENSEHIRVVGPLVAIWFVVFTWPLFVFTPDRRRAVLGVSDKVRVGLNNLVTTLRNVKRYQNIVRFLLVRMIYADGLATVFISGGIFAAGVFGMTMVEVMQFGIVLNVTAGIGAFGFAWIDDYLGSKTTIMASLVGLLVCAAGAVLVEDVTWFWIWGALLGIFVGPAQAASRSMMARLAPPELTTEFFGLYALTGKATAFLGPLLVGVVTVMTESQRAGLAVVLVFFLVGFFGMLVVKEERSALAEE